MATLVFRFERSDGLSEVLGESYENVIIKNSDISVVPIIHWLLYAKGDNSPDEAVADAFIWLIGRFKQAETTRMLPYDTKYDWLIEMDYDKEQITINDNWKIPMADFEEAMKELATKLTLADIHKVLSNKRLSEYVGTNTH